jgi:hypothetical protein
LIPAIENRFPLATYQTSVVGISQYGVTGADALTVG